MEQLSLLFFYFFWDDLLHIFISQGTLSLKLPSRTFLLRYAAILFHSRFFGGDPKLTLKFLLFSSMIKVARSEKRA
jgi:hypothetical protein